MTRTTRRAASAAVVLAVLGWAFRAGATESSATGAGQPSLMAPDARVRGSSQRLVAAISDAASGSQTFRGLVNQIGRTDGIVYVMEGQCQQGVRACLLLSMTVTGANRVLWIRIDPRKMDRDLMGSIGHELQHALEVLSHSSIRSGRAMTLLYKKEGSKEGGHFETDAAIKAGNAVRAELRERAAARAATDAAALTNASSHVRSDSPAIASLIAQASTSGDDRPTTVVRVDNLAGVRAEDLAFAEVRAAAAFSQIGVRIIWTDQETAPRTSVSARFTLILIEANKNTSGAASVFVDALGVAELQVRRGYVFYDRVAALNVRASSSVPSLLGDVMAHELGHLLLPPPGHSPDGIMRPQLYLKLRATETFTKSQARQIVSRLRQAN
jgi:hypothetical protein